MKRYKLPYRILERLEKLDRGEVIESISVGDITYSQYIVYNGNYDELTYLERKYYLDLLRAAQVGTRLECFFEEFNLSENLFIFLHDLLVSIERRAANFCKTIGISRTKLKVFSYPGVQWTRGRNYSVYNIDWEWSKHDIIIWLDLGITVTTPVYFEKGRLYNFIDDNWILEKYKNVIEKNFDKLDKNKTLEYILLNLD